MSSQLLTIWRHSQKSHRMPHMKNIYTPKKKMFKTTATFYEVGVAVGCWVLSLTTNYRDFSAIVSSAAPKKCALVDSTSKTQGFGVGDRSRKMFLSRSSCAWSRFAHPCLLCNDGLLFRCVELQHIPALRLTVVHRHLGQQRLVSREC